MTPTAYLLDSLFSTALPQSPTMILCSLSPHFCPSWVFWVTLLSPSQDSPSLSSQDGPGIHQLLISHVFPRQPGAGAGVGGGWRKHATTLGHRALMSKNKQTVPTKQGESVDTAGSHVGSTVERGSLEKAFRRAPSSA